MSLTNPPALLAADPYAETADLTPDPSSVCAVVLDEADAGSYRLETFADELAAVEAGAWITHASACGQCSSLANLAVYIRRPDLTDPVRDCGLQGIVDGEDANIACLMALGFDEACAQIWCYNTVNTRTVYRVRHDYGFGG